MQKIILLFLIIICGCTSSFNKKNEFKEYKILAIDNQLRDDILIYLLEDSFGGKIVLFSDRLKIGKNKIPFKNYIELKSNSYCTINTYVDSTKYIFEPEGVDSRLRSYSVFIEDFLYINDDTLVVNVYRSNQIFDKYLEVK